MTASAAHPTPFLSTPASLGRRMLNKVPEVTLYFWIIKILCTTVGETAADYMNDTLGFGLTNTTYFMGAVLIACLIAQFRLRKYVPGVYWLAVVLISIFGTLITDNLVDNLGVPLETTTIAFTIALAVTFAVWYASERTLSIHTIVTTRREAFYWLAVLFTFALGTAAGDLFAERMGLGLLRLGADLRRHDRSGRPGSLPPRDGADPGLLDRLHPDPTARCLDRRLDVAADRRWWARAGHHRDQRDLPDARSSPWSST